MDEIYAYLDENPYVRQEDLAEEVSPSVRTIKETMGRMDVERVGRKRYGYWKRKG